MLWPILAYFLIQRWLLELIQETPTTTQSTKSTTDFINLNKPDDDIKDNERLLSENPSDSTLSYNNALYARDYYGKEDILKRKQLDLS
jgi:hypothetical protein